MGGCEDWWVWSWIVFWRGRVLNAREFRVGRVVCWFLVSPDGGLMESWKRKHTHQKLLEVQVRLDRAAG